MKKVARPILAGMVLITIIWLFIGDITPTQPPWFSAEQVSQGEELYSEHCSSCHGVHAEGAKSWRTPDENGHLPPPPLDGAAHTWHHPKSFLQQTILEGGAKLGGVMPPFADKLSADEVDAVIAWIQSLWPTDIYYSWSKREQKRANQ
ncbi:MAG: cytochrome c [Candidatus Polarisedimenticolaceae bacterium]|nr:cytochrome c [Candidatus Polarisedimenticolaceae bacterium]